jgi:membrane-associated protein
MFDVVAILHWLGPSVLIGLFLFIFAECGLLIGVVLPGDAVLFTSGLLAATGAINANLLVVCVVVTVAAILGNICGYWIGAKVGSPLFNRPNAKLLYKGQVEKTQRFFEKHGPIAIVLARFIPLARTLITVIAGIARMDKRKYFVHSTVGAVLWAAVMTLVGGLLGQIPWVAANVNTMLFVITILIVVVSVVPIIAETIKNRRKKKFTEAAVVESSNAA